MRVNRSKRRASPAAKWRIGAVAALAVFLALAVSGCFDSSPPVAPPAAAPATVAGPPPGVPPRFVEIGEAAGVLFTRDDDLRGQHRLVEVNGGGVALFDYDGDGRLDIFLTDGCRLPLAERDGTHSNQLFRNRDDGRFQLVTEAAGLRAEAYFQGCTVGDYDGDGFDDLYVTAFGPNRLWHNNGDGTFREVTAETDVAGEEWSSSAALADLNGDGVLDLYVVNYLQVDEPIRLCPTPGVPDGYRQCPPTMFHGEDDRVYLGDGAGGFREVTRAAGFTGIDGKGLGVVVFDADRDGRPDVYVANDGMPNFLYMNAGTADGAALPTFREEAMPRGAAVNQQGVAEASMGVTAGDYDADGWPDLFMTNFYLETNTLYRNLGQGAFDDATRGSGLGPPSRLRLAFGTEFMDYDNDGRLDLLVTNGHVDNFEYGPTPEPYRMPPQLFRNDGDGKFADVSAWAGPYFAGKWVGRGLAVGDLDNDGDLDAVISHQLDRSPVLRNDTPTENRSVILRIVGRGRSNRSAFGTHVEADGLDQITVREVVGGGSFQSSSDRRVHVGLGRHATLPRLTLRWPSGTMDEWTDLPPGHYLAIEGQPPRPVPAP